MTAAVEMLLARLRGNTAFVKRNDAIGLGTGVLCEAVPQHIMSVCLVCDRNKLKGSGCK